jgi:ABC-type branched-subunit amino acid transport system substrate-binding protein
MNAAAKQGVKKVGVLLCTEYAACEGARAIFRAQAEANGLTEVYDAVASTTQPSYTAECLAAKEAGVEAFAAYVNTTVMCATAPGRTTSRSGSTPISSRRHHRRGAAGDTVGIRH